MRLVPEDVGVDGIELRVELFGRSVATEFGEADGSIFKAVLLEEPAGTIKYLADGQHKSFR